MRRHVTLGLFLLHIKAMSTSNIRSSLTHYQRLGVSPDATSSEIKDAYRKRALTCHPDVAAPDQKTFAEAEFRRIGESYSILIDENRRKKYDASIGRLVTTTVAPAMSKEDQEKQKKRMVRRDADRVFYDAFEGQSVDDILFSARFAKRFGRRPKATTDQRQTHASVFDAAREVAADLERKNLLHSDVKIRTYAPQRRFIPPASKIPFRPFSNMTLPVGVSAPELPFPVPILNSDDTVESVPNAATEGKRAATADLGNPDAFCATLSRLEREQRVPSIHGQLYSYHRPF
jgi:hypothetical protein